MFIFRKFKEKYYNENSPVTNLQNEKCCYLGQKIESMFSIIFQKVAFLFMMMCHLEPKHILSAFKLLIIVLLIAFGNSQAVCALNPNCFEGCSDSTCVYDPSTNPFYNSSLSNATDSYNGPFCCNGCNSGYFLWMDMKTCSSICNIVTGVQTFGNPLTRTCDFMCPDSYLGDPTTTKCVVSCPVDYWINLSLKRCVYDCPSDFLFYYIPTRTCMDVCLAGNFSYLGAVNRTYCSPLCPASLFAYVDNMTCVITCPGNFYGDLTTDTCVGQCPSPALKHPDSKKCELKCFGNYPYGDLDSNFCMKTCPFDVIKGKQKYGENTTSQCVYSCPNDSYAHPEAQICVSECFGNFSVPNNTINQCQIYVYVQGSSLPKITLVVIISVTLGSVVVILFSSFLIYRFYAKKRLIRKPWKYDGMKDIQFSL